MLQTALLASLEHGLNRALRMDPVTLKRLDALAGQIICIECSQPAWQLFVSADAHGLYLASVFPDEPDCTLRGSLTALARLLLADDKQAALHHPDLELHGDTQALQQLSRILQDLDLDWEYELSRHLGPVAAGLLGRIRQHQRQSTRTLRQALEQNLAEYLTEERRSLVGRSEAEARFAELDHLKLAMDRLEARISRLQASVPSPTTDE